LHRRAEIASETCNGPVEHAYQGIAFERIACRDWTSVVVPPKPEAPPVRPVRYLN
jgi:hypothetical protein